VQAQHSPFPLNNTTMHSFFVAHLSKHYSAVCDYGLVVYQPGITSMLANIPPQIDFGAGGGAGGVSFLAGGSMP